MRTWLIELRNNRTQAEMAKMLGISQQMYCAIESGKRNPRINRAKQMAQILGIPWIMFFEAAEDKKEAV